MDAEDNSWTTWRNLKKEKSIQRLQKRARKYDTRATCPSDHCAAFRENRPPVMRFVQVLNETKIIVACRWCGWEFPIPRAHLHREISKTEATIPKQQQQVSSVSEDSPTFKDSNIWSVLDAV